MKKKLFYSLMFYFSSSFSLLAMPSPALTAEGAILIEPYTNTILFQKNIDYKFYPASTTKVLSSLILADEMASDFKITKSQDSINVVPSDSSHIGLLVGDSYSYEAGLHAILLGSDNFVSHDMAIAHAGSTTAFADKMNARAYAIGATHSHFMNAHGYHDPNHYTTPYDLALITKEAFGNPLVAQIAGTPSYPFSILESNKIIDLKHTAPFFNPESNYYNNTVTAAKTGFHTPAGRTLVAQAHLNGFDLIAVVMKSSSPDYFSDINSLFDYGFNNFEWITSDQHPYMLNNKSYSSWAFPYIEQAIANGHYTPSLKSYMDSTTGRDFLTLLQNSLFTLGMNGTSSSTNYSVTGPFQINAPLTTSYAQSLLERLSFDLGFELPASFVIDALNIYQSTPDTLISVEESLYLYQVFLYMSKQNLS